MTPVRYAISFVLLAGQAAAQTNAPLSAIDWLSQSVNPIPVGIPLDSGVTDPNQPNGAAAAEVTVSPLDSASPDVVGLLPSSVTGLPQTLWSYSHESDLTTLMAGAPTESLPAVQELLVMLALAEAKPPLDAGNDGALFMARVDKLLDIGALEQAQALLEAADPVEPALFRRWFDISLLTGTEAPACKMLQDAPDLSATYAVRVFCIARGGDWDTAALILNTGMALGDLDADEINLLLRFLDADMDDGATALPIPDPVTPLKFRLFEAIGEPLTTAQLPRAFAHADLRAVASWRSQLEAAERLARYGAVDDNVLRSLYNARRPAASGGIWDRAEAFQRFDTAIRAKDPTSVATTLPAAWAAVQFARIEVPFARLFADDLMALPLTGEIGQTAFHIALLSSKYEQAAIDYIPTTTNDAFLIAVARGDVSDVSAQTVRETVVYNAFAGNAAIPEKITTLLSDQKLGEALLTAIQLIDRGIDGDSSQITDALTTLRAVGLEDTARRAAIQYILLERAL